ncbi:hypothetical protein H5410_012418 [Solanum commersonii]|uniref:Protein phosphatase n=1 Tax=Solanum commersonii TaxID=4109 RepID=A0A9J6ARF5_SOLCO|nr:hypothetical protein H5410_012418 [Solanum commersonii]
MKNAELAIQKQSSITTIDLMKVLNEAFRIQRRRVLLLLVFCLFPMTHCTLLTLEIVAEKISVPVIAGDVIVLGTDGLFDNVHDFELEAIVNSGVESWESDVPETLAWKIAQYALDNAKNTEVYTPFTRECFKDGVVRNGGKYDDITVIVANIWPL